MSPLRSRIVPLVVAFLAVAAIAQAAGPFHVYTITPCRVADTRNPAGLFGGPALAHGAGRNFPIAGYCGIPSDARAVIFNFAVVNHPNFGHLSVYPAGTSDPGISTLNFSASDPAVANGAIVPLTSGSFSITAYVVIAGGGTAHLIIDVTGYVK